MNLIIKKCFVIVKLISVFIHAINLTPPKLTIAINIAEAVIADLSVLNCVCFFNALFGGIITFLLYMLTETYEFKAWTVIYALWNMIFIYTKGYSIDIAICNNLPALFYALLDRPKSLDSKINTWSIRRCSSIMTQIITINTKIKR